MTGTGVDELFSKREENLFSIIEEMKILKQENAQLKKVNERMVDKLEE